MASKRKSEPVFPISAKRARIEDVLKSGNNALMQLNEIGIVGLKWEIRQIVNVFPQRFSATCLFSEPFTALQCHIPAGTKFSAEGPNKTICRHDIAMQIVSCISSKRIDVSPKLVPLTKDNLSKSMTNVSGERVGLNDALRMLNEKVKDLLYDVTPSQDGFCCSVLFKDNLVKSFGTTKKLAKRNVAAQILKTYFRYVFPEEDNAQSTSIDSTTNTTSAMDIDKLPLNRRKNFSNQIQALIKDGYNKLVSSLEIQYSKRKVLAGILISRRLKIVFPNYHRQQDDQLTADNIDRTQFALRTGWTINPEDCGEILKVLTISTGTKCLSGNEINSLGNTVNDCHAEVISKRALQYFLQQTILRLVNNVPLHPNDELFGTDILEIYSTENRLTYKLKDDVRFHLYVSSSPCGDSRIFFPQGANGEESEEENEEDSHPNRKNRGILRTKIECGEGTIPIKMKHIQTWDGILGGERLRTMSCSDKVCVWNVLGLQGALLSNVLSQPIYLDSITIGSLMQLDHSQRALYERAKGVTTEHNWLSHWPSGQESQALIDDIEHGNLQISADNVDVFRVNTPHILTVTEQDDKCPGKASNFSVNWIVGESGLEIIATNKGVKIDNAPSRLAKRSLLSTFVHLFRWLRVIEPRDGVVHYDEMKSLISYPDNAIGAVNYHRKKIALFTFFEQQNLGHWIGKPMEQDWFHLFV